MDTKEKRRKSKLVGQICPPQCLPANPASSTFRCQDPQPSLTRSEHYEESVGPELGVQDGRHQPGPFAQEVQGQVLKTRTSDMLHSRHMPRDLRSPAWNIAPPGTASFSRKQGNTAFCRGFPGRIMRAQSQLKGGSKQSKMMGQMKCQ